MLNRKDRQWMPFMFEFEDEIQGTDLWLTLFINPEELTQSDPGRITVVQTKGGAFVDHYGSGLVQIGIRGVTGYADRKVGNYTVSGQQHFVDLRSQIRDWWEKAQQYPGKVHLKFYNLCDEENYEVVTAAVNLLRSNSRPLLYQYNVQMTCIIKLDSKVSYDKHSWETWEELISHQSKIPLVYNRLVTETFFLRNLLKKAVDVSKFSEATRNWLNWINKGKEFYNTANKTYKEIDSVISEIEQFSKDIGMFVRGVTSFITKPFELVRDLATALGDVGREMISVKNVPHELVRSFREMQCAINALPSRIFKGFTNPYLFEGESNCGSSLGIAEALVSNYDNSFTATAQIAPERVASQLFVVAQESLTLKEDPIDVAGVYLEVDIARTGNNYLDSWSGRTVRLTSVPSQAVVIDYKALQPTATEKIVLQAAKAKIVQDGDSIDRIASIEYGDPSRWKEIVLYNDLEYPFIVSTEFETEHRAIGVVRFYRDPSYEGAVTIPMDTKLWVPAYRGTNQIDFTVSSTIILPLAEQYVNVPVRAVLAGDIGNVAPNRITGFDPIVGVGKVSNVFGTTGGKIWRIAKPGDIIQIPSSETTVAASTVTVSKTYEELFGIDLQLNVNGEIDAGEEGEPDLKRVVAINNLVQALRNRLATRKRFYVYHPEYGSKLPYYIGMKNTPYWQEIVTLDVKNVCLVDPRIDAIKEFSMQVTGDDVSLSFDAIPVNENTSLPVNLIV